MSKRKKKLWEVLTIVYVLFLYVQVAKAQGSSCKDGDKAGPDNPSSFNTALDQDQGFGYVTYNTLYTLKCCGTVRKWEFSVGDNGDIELQIWRPSATSDKKFSLIGINKYSVSRKDRRDGFVSLDVDDKDRIAVQQNDVIGWYSPLDSLVQYRDGTSNDGVWKIKHDDNIKVGEIADFSNGQKQPSRTYGIQASLAPNNPPAFDQLLTTTIKSDAKVGSTVYTIKVTDADPADANNLKVEMLTKSEFFAFDSKSLALTVSSDINVPEGGQTLTLDFKVIDRCSAVGAGQLKLNIDYVQKSTLPPRTTPTTPTIKVSSTTPLVMTTTPEKTTTTKQSTASTRDDQSSTTLVKTKVTETVSGVTRPASTNLMTDAKHTMASNASALPSTKREHTDAGLIGGVVAGIFGLVTIAVVTTVCVVNKKSKVKPTHTDPEKPESKANGHTDINSGTKNPESEQNSQTEKQPPDKVVSAINGKQQQISKT